jgi:hypothetical protein
MEERSDAPAHIGHRVPRTYASAMRWGVAAAPRLGHPSRLTRQHGAEVWPRPAQVPALAAAPRGAGSHAKCFAGEPQVLLIVGLSDSDDFLDRLWGALR